MRMLAALLVFAGCWSDAKPVAETPIGAVEPKAKRRDAPVELQQDDAFASLTGTGDISSALDDPNIFGGLVGVDADPNAGGVIGGVLGGTGTIGQASGSGSGGGYGRGFGGGVPHKATGPTATLGAPALIGDYDAGIVRRYIKRHMAEFTYCYEKQLLVAPTAAGVAKLHFTVGVDGKLASVRVDVTSTTMLPVASCVRSALERIELPRPAKGTVDVVVPLTFAPS